MRKILPVFLLLLLLTPILHAQSWNWNSTPVRWNNPDTLMETGEQEVMELMYNDEFNQWKRMNLKIWARFTFLSTNSSNVKSTRWLLTERKDFSMWWLHESFGNKVTETQIEFIFDDNVTYPSKFDTLCPGSSFMVTWYASAADLNYHNITIPGIDFTKVDEVGLMIDNFMNQRTLLQIIRNNLNTSQYGNTYDCFNYTEDVDVNYYDTVWKTGNQLFGYNETPINSSVINMYTEVTAQYGNEDPVTLAKDIIVWNLLQVYEEPPLGNTSVPIFFPYNIAIKNQKVLELADLDSVIENAVLGAIKSAFEYINTTFERYLPTEVKIIIIAVNELVNLGIVIISFFIMYQVAKYFFSLQATLRTSLSKSAIVVSQMFFWLIILLIFLYSITHMITLCGMKAGIVLFTLDQLGVGVKAPQSLLDAPIIAWDMAVLSFTGIAVSDCTNLWQMQVDDTGLIQHTMYMNLMDSNVSLILRVDVVLILVFIFIIIIGTLWTLWSVSHRGIKSFGDKVRDSREEYYDEDE